VYANKIIIASLHSLYWGKQEEWPEDFDPDKWRLDSEYRKTVTPRTSKAVKLFRYRLQGSARDRQELWRQTLWAPAPHPEASVANLKARHIPHGPKRFRPDEPVANDV